jgi:hypothetical protein
MKRKKILLTGLVAAAVATAGILYAADHIDTPAVTNQPSDITDLYVFQGQNTANLVFVANTQGLMSPALSNTAKFDENTVLEFNIDNTGDNVEDLVIQCKYNSSTNKMDVYGPVKPSETGGRSKLEGDVTASTDVTAYTSSSAPAAGTGTNGVKVFAGPRDDPFFFDLDAFKKILAGTAANFNNPGTDKFAGTNVMSVVVEVPKTLVVGTAAGASINVWLETKKKI